MKKNIRRILSRLASVAFAVAVSSSGDASFWGLYQPKEPKTKVVSATSQ